MPSGKVAAVPPRVAILPPVPVPYREPLFRALAERGRVNPHVLYLSASQPGWDQPSGWFSEAEGYGSEILGGRQRSRTGRSPITFPRGLGRGADAGCVPDCIVSWEYGPATLRALAWARRRRVPVLVFSELTPWSDAALSALQRRVHRRGRPARRGFHRGVVAGRGAAARAGGGAGAGRGGASERGPGSRCGRRPGIDGRPGAHPRASGGWCADKNLGGADRGVRGGGLRGGRGRARAPRHGSAGGGAAGPGRPARRAGPLPGARRARRARRRLRGRATSWRW